MNLSRISCVQWLVCFVILFLPSTLLAEDGYGLWLRYNKVSNAKLLSYYRKHATEIVIQQSCPMFRAVQDELRMGLQGMIGREIPVNSSVSKKGAIIVGTPEESPILRRLVQSSELELAGDEGYIIGIAGVSGIGTDRNWMGHHFSQANWYAFGRLAWDSALTSGQIAKEWIRMTWSNDPETVDVIAKMMAGSWEACVDYMIPLGLHHLMAAGHHYGPGPDYVNPGRADWSSTYYHKADSQGIGFDRSSNGTNGVSQYAEPLQKLWDSPATCPEKYLLWFHHLPWTHRMSSGKSLWQELVLHYNRGVEAVITIQKAWDSLEGKIDQQRFGHVKARLELQLKNAEEWRDVCLEYFGRFAESPDTGHDK